MRILLLLVCVLTTPLPGQKQQTQMWGPLRFGMSVAEARKALPYRPDTPPKRDQIPGKSVPGTMRLHVPKALLGSIAVSAALYFGEKAEGLTGVLLVSNHANPNYCDMPGNLEKQAAALRWEVFLGELKKQNGEPTSVRTVEGEDSSVNTMLAVWDGESGSPDITLLLMGSCKRIDITVTYAPSGFRKR